MKKLLLGSVLASGLLFSAAGSSAAHAFDFSSFQRPSAPSVPELDPSAAASVVSLVLAGTLVLSHRRKTAH